MAETDLSKHRSLFYATAYAHLYPRLAVVAREKGYCLALHGSMHRDCDLIAAPWSEDAASAEELVDALKSVVGGFVIADDEGTFPRAKAHGRLAWSIHLGGGPYLDLSVMPRVASGSTTCSKEKQR